MQIPDINLDTIADLATRQVVIQLLHLIEAIAAENTQLRDENARLKGWFG